ncbi:MAG: AAA family ATPase [Planctomycetes bacterium]|nr:AAA family ATPase [Planctomycetota bacterium]
MKAITQRVRDEVGQMIVGQADVIDLVITALLAGGHCLLVGVPGLAKTTLVQTLASVLDLDFKRVQFTPDLMPTDITGTDVMEINDTDGRRVFRFLPGPIFTNMLLADEINRTPPKTQAALLEAMQEMSVTSGNTTYPLKPPFFVLATQNPLEQEGTYPLPEAQLDRFMFNIHLDYPSSDEETVIVDRTTGSQGRPPGKVIGGEEIMRLQEIVRLVPVSKHVLTYATTLARMTRPETKGCPAFVTEFVHCGAGPRAAQNLILGAKARAVMQGRPNVSVADIKAVAIPVLRHRIFTNFSADAEGVTAESLVKKLLKTVTEPKMEPAEREREPEAESESAIRQADAFTVTCSKCGKTLKLSRRAVGRNAKCPNCKHVFPVEAPGGSHAAEPETEETP